MKKVVLLSFIFLSGVILYAKEDDITEEQFNRFLKTKTLVVLEDNPMSGFNFMIKELVKKQWEITEYDFITFSEFKEVFTNPDYSFLLLSQYKFKNDRTKPQYNFLSVWLGKEDVILYENLPEVIGVPMSYKTVDEDTYLYKLGILIRFIQNHVRLLQDNPKLIDKNNVLKHYNENVGDVKTKTLYITKNDLSPEVNTLEKIHQYYPHEVKIVSREEIKKAIDEKREDVVFLHKIGPEGTRLSARCYKVLVGAADAKFYYFDYHMIDNDKPDSFLPKDFKRISRNGFFRFLW